MVALNAHTLTLVIGGASSGKSAFAETLLLGMARRPAYIATAQAFDAEMSEKIARHRDARGEGWRTIEAPTDLAGAIAEASGADGILIDCATLWLSNLMLAEADIDAAEAEAFETLDRRRCPVVVVSNEVGHGIVPDTSMGRRFRSIQGGFNQRLAARADRVVAVMAGLPLALKGEPV
jgi:adenosylcobinamide kinase/adenosylcobinamide-phosphate guanylyltransferase